MNEQEFEAAMNRGELDEQYTDFIMECQTVGNGNVLLNIMERGTYYQAFKESMVTK